jgi:hypothetical protein
MTKEQAGKCGAPTTMGVTTEATSDTPRLPIRVGTGELLPFLDALQLEGYLLDPTPGGCNRAGGAFGLRKPQIYRPSYGCRSVTRLAIVDAESA